MKKIISFLTLMLCILSTCCVRPASKPKAQATQTAVIFGQTIHADTAFTSGERAKILQALTNWNIQTAGLVDLTVKWDLDFNSVSSIYEHRNDHMLIRWTSTMPLVAIENEACDCKLLGYSPGSFKDASEPARVHLVVDSLWESENEHVGAFVDVTMHEFGHVLGLAHIKDDKALMRSGYIGGLACLSQADLDEFCQVNECGDKVPQMVACERFP